MRHIKIFLRGLWYIVLAVMITGILVCILIGAKWLESNYTKPFWIILGGLLGIGVIYWIGVVFGDKEDIDQDDDDPLPKFFKHENEMG